MRHERKSPRLIALFFLGCLLFSYPLLSLANTDGMVLGIPALYVYLFTSWALFIGLAALIVSRSR